MTELYRRILNLDTSAAERDLLCETSFGMPFSEVIYEMRLNDLKEGVDSGEYFILSVRNVDMSLACDDALCACKVFFRVYQARPYALDELQAMTMLYDIDPPVISVSNLYRTGSRFYATLYGADAFEWAIAQIRRMAACVI